MKEGSGKKEVEYYLRLYLYKAPAAINIPKTIIMTGQKSGSVTSRTSDEINPGIQESATIIIMMPMISPTIAPPWGSPKHCSSARFPNCSPHSSIRLSNLSSRETSRFAPHLVQ